MSNVSLPLTFAGAFASDKGLEQLHSKLDHQLQEDETLRAFFVQQSSAYRSLSSDLIQSVINADAGNDKQQGFALDDGGSFKRAFVGGLQAYTEAQAGLYRKVATDLERKLVQPYTQWQNEHSDRLMEARKQAMSHVTAFRKAYGEVEKAKNAYDSKCVKLEEEEDEVGFHTSPVPSATNGRSPLAPLSIPSTQDQVPDDANDTQGTASDEPAKQGAKEPTGEADTVNVDLSSPVERKSGVQLGRKVSVVDRLKALAKQPGSNSSGPATIQTVQEEDDESVEDEKNQKRLPETPAPATTSPSADASVLEIAGIENGAKEWSTFFSHAAKSIPKRDLKIPIIGTYHDVHSGEDIAEWFRDNLPVLDGNYDRAFELARTLSEDLFLLKLVGELGNKFHDSHDAHYQFKPECFYLGNPEGLQNHKKQPSFDLKDHLTRLPNPISPRLRPSSPDPSSSPNMSSTSTFLARSNTIISSISSKLQPLPPTQRLEKARQEAIDATGYYKMTVRRVEGLRLLADQHVEGYLQYLQKASTDRLRFQKATLQRYQTIIEPVLPQAMLQAPEREASRLLAEAVSAESDIQGLCEMYRASAYYRPRPITFIDHYAESIDSHFGVDLARWREVQEHRQPGNSLSVPPVLQEMLAYLKEGYGKIESSDEKRKIWYLEIPLRVSFQLRQALNDARQDAIPTNLLKQSDLPVVASVVKLYFLELDPPVIPYAQHEELKRMYPVVGSSDHQAEADEKGRVSAIQNLLTQIPAVNLITLDALIHHIHDLLQDTKDGGDSEEEYLAKIGLSMGKCIARPPVDTLGLSDRIPSYFLIDLIRLWEQVLPSAIAIRKGRETERFAPKRKRTAPIDVRLSRSNLGQNVDINNTRALLEDQLHRKDPRSARGSGEGVPAMSDSPHKENHASMDAAASGSSESSATITRSSSFVSTHSQQPDGQEADQAQASGTSLADPVPISETMPHSDTPTAAADIKPRRQAPQPPVLNDTSPFAEDAPFEIPQESGNTASAVPKLSPVGTENKPFEIPADHHTSNPSQGADLHRGHGLNASLSRTARVSKGPRALGDTSSIPAGRVKSAAQRFSVDYNNKSPS